MAAFTGLDGPESYPGTIENDDVHGGRGADTLSGASGDDVLYSRAPYAYDIEDSDKDVLSGGAGADLLVGGAGDDMDGGIGGDGFVLDLRRLTAGVTLDLSPLWTGGQVTVAGGVLRDFEAYQLINGTGGNDVISLGAGAPAARTGGSIRWATDYLDGVFGDAGDDSIVGGSAGDLLDGGAGADTLDGGGGHDTLRGAAGRDVLNGGAGDDVLADDLRGGSPVGQYSGGDGRDTLTLIADDDAGVTFDRSRFTEYVQTNSGTAILSGIERIVFTNLSATGRDVIRISGGDDIVRSGGGDDLLFTGSGVDYMEGGAGNDVYIVETVGDLVVEFAGEGYDEVLVSLDAYVLTDHVERLASTRTSGGTGLPGQRLTGNAWDNVIVGSTYADTLSGAGGSDRLEGGTDVDTAAYAGLARGYSRSQTSVSGGLEGGTDTLVSMEVLQFADGRFTYHLDDPAAVLFRLYDAAFARTPDALGFEYWLERHEAGETFDQIADRFTASQEFFNRFGDMTDEQFIEALYSVALNRPGDSAGVDYWLDYLSRPGTDWGDVLLRFGESQENRNGTAAGISSNGIWVQDDDSAVLARLFDSAFDRAPDQAGFLAWRAQLAGGTTADALADAFLLTAEAQAIYGGLDSRGFVQELYRTALNREATAAEADAGAAYLQSHDRGDLLLSVSESAEHVALYQPYITDGIMFV